MPLDKQCYIFSIGTDSFYDEKESYIHDRMTKLYRLLWKGKSKNNKKVKAKLKQKENPGWKRNSVNRVLKKEKNKLISLLEEKAGTDIVRQLKEKDLIDKNIISLFESDLIRCSNIKQANFQLNCFKSNFIFIKLWKI